MPDNPQADPEQLFQEPQLRPNVFLIALAALAAIVMAWNAVQLYTQQGKGILAIAGLCLLSIVLGAAFVLIVCLPLLSVTLRDAPTREARKALWLLTSADHNQCLWGARQLALTVGDAAKRAVDALRRERADLPDEIDQVVAQTTAALKSTRARLARYGPPGMLAVLTAAAVAMRAAPYAWDLPDGLSGIAASVFCAFLFVATAAVVLSALVLLAEGLRDVAGRVYQKHHERELIWQINSSESDEKTDAAQKLALWGTDASLQELFEASHDDDARVAQTARRAHIVVKVIHEHRTG